MSYTCLEDLSNEVFYIIFEYIDYYDLLNGFSNLNHRFEHLLNYPFLSLKINVHSTSASEVGKYCREFLIPNKHRIVSLYLNDRLNIKILSPFHIIDSSFNRLESVVFNRVPHHEFIALLPTLIPLPRLFSIIVNFNDKIVDLTEIYRLVFLLPLLKKFELSVKGYSLTIGLPMNTTSQQSHIERIIINHACNLTELTAIFSYLPELTHLTCMELSRDILDIQEITSIKMLNLTNVTFHMCNVEFNWFDIFITIMGKQLRVLRLNTSGDSAYLDATRWERLISVYMPYLHIFQFEYHEYHYQTIEFSAESSLLNQFTSSFWSDRRWFFEILTDIDYWPPIKISYCIRPYRKTCCSVNEQENRMKLSIDRLYFAISRESLVDKVFSFITTFPITHVTIDCKKFSYIKFIQLLSMLPNLTSLGVCSLSFLKWTSLSWEEMKLIRQCSTNNQITKLELRSFIEKTDFDKIQLFIDLCSQMKYLQVKCENTSNIEFILQYILSKNKNKFSSFNLLCLSVPITNDQIVDQLQETIHREKLLQNFKITRTSDKIYLRWTVE